MTTRLGILAVGVLLLAACASGQDQARRPERPAELALPAGPSALEAPGHPDLPEPTIDLDQLISGGPPPDGIPPIDAPNYTAARDVDFLDDVEPVLVLTIGDDTRIFPVQIMTWHEIVNDTIGGVPVTVSYCPLCNSAITYDRRLDMGTEPTVVDFGTSGMLYNSALIMYDRQTESLWSHFSGEAVAGVLTGVSLERFPTATVGWKTARDARPDALVLNRDTGHTRSYGTNPYGGYDDVNSSPFLYRGEEDGRLAAKTRVIGISIGSDAVAVRTEALDPLAAVDLTLAGRELTVWRTPGTASALDTSRIADGRDVGATNVFDRRVDGAALAFTVAGDDIIDARTGSRWSILGTAIDGSLAGTQLTPVEHVDTFWFAWAAFLPETEILPPI